MGYEGYIVNVRGNGGIVGEIQVVTPEMMYGKLPPDDAIMVLGKDVYDSIKKATGKEAGIGHDIYEKVRENLNDTKLVKQLSKESVDYYNSLR